MDSFDEIWSKILRYIKNNLSEAAYNVCFSDDSIDSARYENGVIIITVKNEFKKGLLEFQMKEMLDKAILNILGFPIEYKTELSEDATTAAQYVAPTAQPPEADTQTSNTDSGAAAPGGKEFTFDNFIVGASNNVAYNAAKRVATHEPLGGVFNPLFIYGGSGLGKTHLMSAIMLELSRRHPGLNMKYTTLENYMNDFIMSIQHGTMEDFRHRYRSVDALFIDDIQFIKERERTQEEFFHTFNDVINSSGLIVITSDCPPRDLTTLTDRIRSRFEAGLIADIQPPDIETRIAIINQNCEKCGLHLPRQAVTLIAERISKNIRQIEGVINKLAAMESLTSQAITVDTVRTVINDFEQSEKLQSETVEEIINYVADYYDVNPADIISKNRSANLVNARNVCFYVIKQTTAMSYKAIGERFSDREHSTVIHSIDKLTDQMKIDARLRTSVNDIIRHFQQ